MAATATLSHQTPHPLHASLGKAWSLDELESCRALIPDDCDQPPVMEDHISNLATLFVKHNADKVLGIHLIHGHFQIPEGRILVGTNFDSPAGRWTRTIDIQKLQVEKIHGHIFVVVDGGEGVLAHEFQEGPLPDMPGVGTEFLPEFVNYIVAHNLEGLLGLQVLCCAEESASMSELVLDEGTVMIHSEQLKNTVPTRQTGWKFEAVDGNPRTCTASETHSRMTTGNHKVFNAGKPVPEAGER